ncbi:MAG: hypothetical protein R2939_04360 [Kofleriaceae bacterium]
MRDKPASTPSRRSVPPLTAASAPALDEIEAPSAEEAPSPARSFPRVARGSGRLRLERCASCQGPASVEYGDVYFCAECMERRSWPWAELGGGD